MVSTLVAGLLMAGCGNAAPKEEKSATKTTTAATAAPVVEGKVVFEKADVKGDDNGAGTYTYPTDRVFSPAAFDLTNFQIADAGANYNFIFTIATEFKMNGKSRWMGRSNVRRIPKPRN